MALILVHKSQTQADDREWTWAEHAFKFYCGENRGIKNK